MILKSHPNPSVHDILYCRTPFSSFLISHQCVCRIRAFPILLKMAEYKQEQHSGVSEPNLRKYLSAWLETLDMVVEYFPLKCE